MIAKNIKVFSQNIQKNNLIINTILETWFDFDIVFIQEPSWITICAILSSKSGNGEELVGVPNHPNWIMFTITSSSIYDYPRVITYINIRLSSFWFSFCKDILNHRDISPIFFLINIYSDSTQLALKYLKDTEVDISNVLIMAGDFNIRDSFWDPLYLHHSVHSGLLIDIMDSLSLGLSYPTNSVPTRYADNNQSSNLVIDLMFLRYRLEELDKHTIHPEWRLLLDHTPLTISIPLKDLHIHNRKQTITKSSVEEKAFIKDLINNIFFLTNVESLENAVDSFATAIEKAWEKNSKIVNISKHSKSWWDMNCSRDLENYRSTRSLVN